MLSSNSPRIIVAGDYASGKTTFCQRMERPAEVRLDSGSTTRDHYSMTVDSPLDHGNASADETPQSSSFVLVDQRQLCSLQRMVFRRAVGLIVMVDATTMFSLFTETRDAPMANTRTSTLSSSTSPFNDSPSRSRGSSQYFAPPGGVSWESCLAQLVLMWKVVVQDESELCNERGSSFKLPLAVIFTKMDLLANEDEEAVMAFKYHCGLECRGKEIQADVFAFVSLVEASSDEMKNLRLALSTCVNRRLSTVPVRQRRQSVAFNDPHVQEPEKKRNKPCCGS
jgi:GTPase SAR1 family protein